MGYINEHLGKYEQFSLESINENFKDKTKGDGVNNKYVTIFHGMATRFDLSPTENIMISMIIRLSRKKGWCYLGQGKFATSLNIDVETIRGRLKAMEERGLIERGNEKSEYKTLKWRANREVDEMYWSFKKQLDTLQNISKESLDNN